MLSNAYFLAKFRFDTAENEPAKNLQNFRKCIFRKCIFRKCPAVGSPCGVCEGLPDGAAVPASEATGRRPVASGVLGAVPDGPLASSSCSLPRTRLRHGGSSSPTVRGGALGGHWLLAISSRRRPSPRPRSRLWSASAIEPPGRCRDDGEVRPAAVAGVPSGRSTLGPGAGE